MPRAAAVSFHERTGRFPLTSSLAVVALLLLHHCFAEQTINNQQSVIGKTLSGELQPVQPIEAMKTCLGDTHSPNLHLFSSQLLCKVQRQPRSIGLCVMLQEACGRQHREEDSTPSGLDSWPLTIRKEDHSVSGTTLFFLPTFQVQHPTSNTPITNTQHPAFSTTFHISESYLSSSSLGTTKGCQDAIWSLLPCNTAANLGCFFRKTQRMKISRFSCPVKS